MAQKLPRGQAETFAMPPAAESSLRKHQPPTILVVDDTRAIRHVLVTLVREHGFACLTAQDGYTGWKVVRESLPHFIITDLEMPNWDGLALIEAVRNSLKRRIRCIPILVYSGHTDVATVEAAMTAGADGFLNKPRGLSDIPSRIRYLLSGDGESLGTRTP